MQAPPQVIFERTLDRRPAVSLILLDWSCRESFHIFDYLEKQDVPRDMFEVLWIEYYDHAAPEIAARIRQAEAQARTPPVDRWILMNMPRTAYYHKHLMYNVGVLLSRAELVMIGDSDAMVTPRFVRALCEAFEADRNIVLHLDEVRSRNRRFYPFNYPTFEQVLEEGCINWRDGTTTGLLETFDPLHALNYGACFCARREDIIAIGGADEHMDYLGHICGPYDLTWRLRNLGRREVWHSHEFLYHVWHPGSDGDDNYLGPHDGRNVSTLALQTRRNGRTMPLVENPVVRQVRESGLLPQGAVVDVIRNAVGDRPVHDWNIDDLKRSVSDGRVAWAQRRYGDAVRIWEKSLRRLDASSRFLSDLAWAYYFERRRKDARRTFEQAIAIEPDNPDAHRGLGWTLAMLGRHEDALTQYTIAIDLADSIDPLPLQEAYRGRGWSRFHLERFEGAIADFVIALRLTKTDDLGSLQDVHRGLGWSHLRRRQYSDAAGSFREALAVLAGRPGTEFDDAQSGLSQAEAHLRLDNQLPTGSESEFLATAADDGRFRLWSSLRADLGWALYASRRYHEAASLFDDAIGRDRTNQRALCGAGWVALHLGHLAVARRRFDELLNLSNTDRQSAQEALRGRAWVAYRTGDYARAIADFGQALQLTDGEREQNVIEDIHRGRCRAYYGAGLKKLAFDEMARVAGPLSLGTRLRLRAGVYRNRWTTAMRRGRGQPKLRSDAR